MVFFYYCCFMPYVFCKSNCFGCKSDLVHLCTWQTYECLKCVRQRNGGISIHWRHFHAIAEDQKFQTKISSCLGSPLSISKLKWFINVLTQPNNSEPKGNFLGQGSGLNTCELNQVLISYFGAIFGVIWLAKRLPLLLSSVSYWPQLVRLS